MFRTVRAMKIIKGYGIHFSKWYNAIKMKPMHCHFTVNPMLLPMNLITIIAKTFNCVWQPSEASFPFIFYATNNKNNYYFILIVFFYYIYLNKNIIVWKIYFHFQKCRSMRLNIPFISLILMQNLLKSEITWICLFRMRCCGRASDSAERAFTITARPAISYIALEGRYLTFIPYLVADLLALNRKHVMKKRKKR